MLEVAKLLQEFQRRRCLGECYLIGTVHSGLLVENVQNSLKLILKRQGYISNMLGPHLFRPQRCPCHPRGVLLKSSRPTSIGCTGLNSRELILSKLRSCNCMILSESEARWCWVTCLALPTTSCSRALTPGLLYLLRGLLLIYTLLIRVTKLLCMCSSCGRVTWPSCPSAAAACHH